MIGCYVMSRFGAYKNDYPFAKTYIALRDDAVVTALSLMEHSAVLCAGSNTDYEELCMLLPLLSVQTLMVDSAAAQHLPFPVLQRKQAFCFAALPQAAAAEDDAPLREVYDLISRSIPGSFPPDEEAYLHFLSDFTFRRNRGLARLKAAMENGRVCACALTAAESSACAVISGVACAEDCRGKGHGTAVVHSLAADLKKEQKNVHVIALNDSAGAFYRRIGFLPTETITWLKP